MTSTEIKVKFFEHEDNPLPEDGSVRVITTRDGFDLRLGLWPVPGFKISVVEASGDPESQEETSSVSGNGTKPVSSESSNADPSVSAMESGAESADGENPAESAAAHAADQSVDGNSVAGEDAGTAISEQPAPGGESSDDVIKTTPAPASDEADPGNAAVFDAEQSEHDAETNVDPHADDAKLNETLQDQTDGEADAGILLQKDAALVTVDAGASEANTTRDASPSAEDIDVSAAAGQPEEDDSASRPDNKMPDPDDKKNVAASSPELTIAKDLNEQVGEKDAASTDTSRDQSPVVDATSESAATDGEDAATDAPSADDHVKTVEMCHSATGASGERSSAETPEPTLPLEQAITMSGTIIVLNGRSEFIEKYAEVIRELIDRGFCVAALDWRGQGGSERVIKRRPLKGHIDDMDSYVEDLITLLDFLETTNCPKPYYCLAHSTGGQILLRAAPLISSRISRAVTTAPFFDLASYRTPKPLVYAFASTLTYAGLGEMYAPGAGRNPPSDDPFEGNAYSSDPRRYQRTTDLVHRHKELAIGGPTVSWMYAALKSAGELFDPDFLSSITLPVMMLSASDDKVVSVQAVEDFASMARTVNHLSIPGARHEILMERDEIRSQFWAAFDAFIPGED